MMLGRVAGGAVPARRHGRGRAARDLRGDRDRPRRHDRAARTARLGHTLDLRARAGGSTGVGDRIVILADHDASGAGLRAAETAARRLRSEGREVVIAMPPREGDDFNDLLLREGPRPSRRPSRRRDATGRRGPGADRPAPAATTLSPTRACRSCAPTRAISGGRSRRPGVCCSPRTARPGSTATPASRPGSCPTRRGPPGRRHPDRGAPAPHAGPPRRLAAERQGRARPGAAAHCGGEVGARHPRSRPAGARRHREHAGVRPERHAADRAGLSPGRAAALRPGSRVRRAADPRAPDTGRRGGGAH